MKTQTCFVVLESGKIAIGEMPEEPITIGHEYTIALKAALQSAVECADQEKAMRLLKVTPKEIEYGMVEPGVYPIPGIRYEVKIDCDKECMGFCEECNHAKKVAVIIDSPPPLAKELQPEDQEELWLDAYDYFHDYFYDHFVGSDPNWPATSKELKAKFEITRREQQ